MSTIRIKRSTVAGNPGTLAAGELAYSSLNGAGGNRLYIGMGAETGGNAANHFVIGGTYYTGLVDASTAGTLATGASSIPILSATGTIDKWLPGNLSLTGDTIATTDTNGNLILNPNGTGKVSIANAYTLPRVDGTANYVLTTNGAGVVSWAAASSNLSIAGTSGTGTIALTSQSLTVTGSNGISATAANQTITVSFNTGTLVTNAVSATTSTSAATAYALANTSTTRVGYADNANTLLNTSSVRVGFADTSNALANSSTYRVGYADNANTLLNTSSVRVGFADNANTLLNTSSVRVGYADNANTWYGGTVPNPVTFSSPVTFSGTTTYVLSTNTIYTDNIVELHTTSTGVTGLWTVDDGKDIGFRFHYYGTGADQNAALVLANDTKYLEWYNTGAESNTGTFVGSNYGTFKTGGIILANTTGTTGAGTGALQVAGGVYVGGNLYVGGAQGIITATTFVGNLTGTASTANALANSSTYRVGYADNANTLLNTSSVRVGYADTANTLANSSTYRVAFADTANALANSSTYRVGYADNANTLLNTSTVRVGFADTANNLAGGVSGSIPYQTGGGATTMLGIGSSGQVLQVSTVTGLAIWGDIDGGIY